ncbi:undecaprenyl-phosphate glucose phosphotransferase [Mucilaginibacter ginkgonis]|uniref:Undecaprenyl-phosphate glucose phosphotransferase n=1 Tax=Mucilaginibacter ginkgonis TaxID=2682091 RepID=A0A6I4HYM5_9SPHI|nr:undecaprenyl-phosphate glucose phosphotransferase [Mucilaginibacter ginkgonis]QQL51449.1 undecaprenyl-phosphate glucose phosphotransferase [Mucilaginibacter ginkgonis]
MIHRYATFIKAANLVVDYIVLNLSLLLAYVTVSLLPVSTIRSEHYLPLILFANLIWFLSANISGLYSGVLNKDAIITYRNVFRTYLLFVALISVTVFITGTKSYTVTRQYLIYALGIFAVLLGLWKLIFLGIRKGDRHVLISKRNVAIVGARRVGNDLYEYMKENPDIGYNMLGFFDDKPEYLISSDLLLGTTDTCLNYINEKKVQELFCTLPNSEADTIDLLMREADKHMIRFKLVPEYYNYNNRTTIVQSFGSIPVISLRPEPLENTLNRVIKRIFDVAFSLFMLVFVASWLIPLMGIIIKLQSKGPVFFTQARSGLDNKQFMCVKLRSMRISDDAHTKQATRNDSRLTPIGAFMRKTNIDELPQFFNVLVGDMSVVGPRPHMLRHTEQYAKEIEKYMVRHLVKPGVTGWAQVRGYRGETKDPATMEKRIEHDVWYLENWSFLLDMKIIFLTVWVTLVGDDNAF